LRLRLSVSEHRVVTERKEGHQGAGRKEGRGERKEEEEVTQKSWWTSERISRQKKDMESVEKIGGKLIRREGRLTS